MCTSRRQSSAVESNEENRTEIGCQTILKVKVAFCSLAYPVMYCEPDSEKSIGSFEDVYPWRRQCLRLVRCERMTGGTQRKPRQMAKIRLVVVSVWSVGGPIN